MKNRVVPDTIMSDEEVEEMAMGYTTISEQERRRRKAAKSRQKPEEKTRRLPNGEIDWDSVFGVKKRKPVEVSGEVMSDEEIDMLAQ